MAKKLGYDFLDKNHDPPIAVGDFVLVEVIAKTSSKRTATGIVYQVNENAERTPYFIVRGVSKNAQDAMPKLKAGDVISSGSRDLVSWVNGNGDRYATINYKDISVVWSKANANPEVYIEDAELNLSGSVSED